MIGVPRTGLCAGRPKDTLNTGDPAQLSTLRHITHTKILSCIAGTPADPRRISEIADMRLRSMEAAGGCLRLLTEALAGA